MSRCILKIRNLHKSYSIKKKIVKNALVDISLDLMEGEILSLLGVNGAGKTTLSSIIASLYPATQGTIFWKDRPIYNDLLSYRYFVGFCPQQQNLDPYLTLEQNLYYQGKYYGIKEEKLTEKIHELFEKLDLKEYAQSKSNVLSGGYKQRFLLARSLIHEPQLLILDEPTVGLDPQIRHKLWECILELKKEGVSILLTTHYLDEAEKLSDRVCLLEQGKILTVDTPEKLMNRCQKDNLEEVFMHMIKEGDHV